MNNLPEITNAIEADFFTRKMCEEYFAGIESTKEERSQWCREYFAANFPRLLSCHMGQVLMGVIDEDPCRYGHKIAPF